MLSHDQERERRHPPLWRSNSVRYKVRPISAAGLVLVYPGWLEALIGIGLFAVVALLQ